jgi:hypothetical protein
MRRIIPLVVALVLAGGCQDHTGPHTPLEPDDPRWGAIGDADHGGPNPHARWLEPLVRNVDKASFGTFDPTVHSAGLHVVCLYTNDGDAVDGGHGCSSHTEHWHNPENAVNTYRVSDGTLVIQDDHYHAQVALAHLSVTDGDRSTIYRLVATVRPLASGPPVVVAYADIRVLPNGRARNLTTGDEIGLVSSVLPARIRLDEGVIAQAVADVPAIVASFQGGPVSVTIVEPNEPTAATFEEEGEVKAAFLFDGDEVVETIALVIGRPKDEAGEDVCGEVFPFEKSGCIRALAVSLENPEPFPSPITSGFEFENEVEFCIATGIDPALDTRPWQLVKIDDKGQGPEFEVIPQDNGDACNLLGPVLFSPVSLRTEPAAWFRHHVVQRAADFLVRPLYAGHPADRMGGTLLDLSDITAALLTEMEFVGPLASEAFVGQPIPITVHVTYAAYEVESGEEPIHGAANAADVAVTFYALGGLLLVDPQAVSGSQVLTLNTGGNGQVTVWLAAEAGDNTITVNTPNAIGSIATNVNGIVINTFGSITDPAGDANPSFGHQPDIATATAAVVGTNATFTMTFHSGFSPDSTRVQFILDMDQDISTGHPGVDSSNNDSHLMGSDYAVDIGGAAFGSLVRIIHWPTPDTFTRQTLAIEPTVLADGYQVVIPLLLLGGGSGIFNFKAISVTQISEFTSTGIHDYVTDLGLDPGTTQPVPQID